MSIQKIGKRKWAHLDEGGGAKQILDSIVQCKFPCAEGRYYFKLSLIYLYLCVEKILIINNAFSLHDIWPRLSRRTLRVMKIYNFGSPFVGYHYYILSLSDVCLGIEKKIFKRNIAFSYDLYGHTLAQEPLTPRDMKFTILLDLSLVNINMQLECLNHAPEEDS